MGRGSMGQGCGRSGQSYDSDNFPTEARGSLAVLPSRPSLAGLAGRWLWQKRTVLQQFQQCISEQT